MLKTWRLVFFVVLLEAVTFAEEIIDLSCTLESSGTSGKCKLLTQCKQIRDEVLISHNLPKTCGFHGTQPIVCCPISKQPGDKSKQKCKEYSSYARIGSPQEITKYECEHRIKKRIVGGIRVSRKEFPHMAAVGFGENPSKISWSCGGSIISERHILTVAHCVINKHMGKPKLVRVGITTLIDINHRQDLEILEIIPHPQYKPPLQENDIAILKLKKAIELNSYARPACLYLNHQISVRKAIATGWGLTDYAGTGSDYLLKVTLDIADHDFCNMTYKDISSKRLKNGIRDDMHLCAGSQSEQKDTCQGDAGGPLQIYHDEDDDIKCMYDLIGVTSFGKACFGGPSVYTRVSHYVEWIENTVWA